MSVRSRSKGSFQSLQSSDRNFYRIVRLVTHLHCTQSHFSPAKLDVCSWLRSSFKRHDVHFIATYGLRVATLPLCALNAKSHHKWPVVSNRSFALVCIETSLFDRQENAFARAWRTYFLIITLIIIILIKYRFSTLLFIISYVLLCARLLFIRMLSSPMEGIIKCVPRCNIRTSVHFQATSSRLSTMHL
jgi:hypothetical protein